MGTILVVYGIEPQSHRAHGGRTDGDDYYPGSNLLAFQVLEYIKENCASL